MRNPSKRDPKEKPVPVIQRTPTPPGGMRYMLPNGRGSSMPYVRTNEEPDPEQGDLL